MHKYLSSSQLQPEHSLLQGFEDEVIIEKSKKATELLLPDLLLSSSHAAGTISKSAATPRIYFEEKSREKKTFFPNLCNLSPRSSQRKSPV